MIAVSGNGSGEAISLSVSAGMAVTLTMALAEQVVAHVLVMEAVFVYAVVPAGLPVAFTCALMMNFAEAPGLSVPTLNVSVPPLFTTLAICAVAVAPLPVPVKLIVGALV